MDENITRRKGVDGKRHNIYKKRLFIGTVPVHDNTRQAGLEVPHSRPNMGLSKKIELRKLLGSKKVWLQKAC